MGVLEESMERVGDGKVGGKHYTNWRDGPGRNGIRSVLYLCTTVHKLAMESHLKHFR
jgi:hypothetical protein